MDDGFKRDDALDVLKGLAILLMVYGHTPRYGTIAEAQTCVIGWIYLFHMPFFLMISGYLFGFRDSVSAVRSSIRRVWIPYCCGAVLFLVGGVFAGWNGIETSGSYSGYGIRNALYLFVMGRPGGAMWFLYALGACQCVLALSLSLARRYEVSRIFAAVLAMLFLCLVGWKSGCVIYPWAVLYFFIGVALRGFGEGLPASVFGLIPAAFIAWNYGDAMCRDVYYPFRFFFSFFLLVFFYWVSRHAARLRIGRFFGFIGRHTLWIVILHPVFNVALKPFLRSICCLDLTGVLFTVANVVLVVAFCLVSEHIGSFFLSRISSRRS